MLANITAIQIWTKGKDGNPLMGQYGPYVRVGIKATATNPNWDTNAWLTYMCKPDAAETKLKVGMNPDIEVSQNGQYFNWKPIKHGGTTGAMSPEIVEKLFEHLRAIELKLTMFNSALSEIRMQIGELSVEEVEGHLCPGCSKGSEKPEDHDKDCPKSIPF